MEREHSHKRLFSGFVVYYEYKEFSVIATVHTSMIRWLDGPIMDSDYLLNEDSGDDGQMIPMGVDQ